MLSLYWPVSSCPAFYDVKTEIFEYFCSPYTNIDQPASERLVLHGLWPTFATNGNYQGWPQYCSSKVKDWSVCHIDGNLCPWKNTSRSDFTQSHYEYCLATEHVEPCIIDGKEILQAEFERLKLYAPGYLNDYNLFLNHEWSKHGKYSNKEKTNTQSYEIRDKNSFPVVSRKVKCHVDFLDSKRHSVSNSDNESNIDQNCPLPPPHSIEAPKLAVSVIVQNHTLLKNRALCNIPSDHLNRF